MNNENEEKETPENQGEGVAPETTTDEGSAEEASTEEPADAPEGEQDNKDLKSALAQKDHYREKSEKADEEIKKLEKELNAKIDKSTPGEGPALDIEDYIDISASLEGLDQREKEKLAREHKLTKKPLSEIRQDEDFVLWQEAYRAKKEKEAKALKPNSAQGDSDKPQTLNEKLANATLAEKEKILAEAGLWKSPRARADRTTIGDGRGN